MALDVNLLRGSFKKVGQNGDALVEAFYNNLFAQLPEAAPLFPSDMRRQRQKFLLSLTTIIQSIEHRKSLFPYLAELGKNHKASRVAPAHYPAVKKALLDTIAQFLGPDWPPEVEESWNEAYDIVAKAMLEGVSS